MSLVMSFTSFINESKINEMRHHRRGPYGYRGGYGSANGTSDYYQVNAKDEMRAKELSKRKINTRDSMTPLQIAIGNAGKMAKVITDPGKLIARMQAVYNEWGPGPVLQPFIDRIIELEPQHKKYVAAWRIGLRDGEVAADPASHQDEDDMDAVANIMASLGMLPPTKSANFQGNSAEKIIYQVAFDKALEEAGIPA
jgi:hypothetical protein